MADLAAKVMLGSKLADLGYGTWLYRRPPYVAVKVPVFSFEKLADADSILGPEMKSTGGDLTVREEGGRMTLTGETVSVFEGTLVY